MKGFRIIECSCCGSEMYESDLKFNFNTNCNECPNCKTEIKIRTEEN